MMGIGLEILLLIRWIVGQGRARVVQGLCMPIGYAQPHFGLVPLQQKSKILEFNQNITPVIPQVKCHIATASLPSLVNWLLEATYWVIFTMPTSIVTHPPIIGSSVALG